MRFERAALWLLCLFVCATALTTAYGERRRGGRGGRNKQRKGTRGERKKVLKWKNSSMPKKGDRLEVLFEKETLELDCKASGKPKPSTMWLKDGRVLQASERVTLKKHRLIIPETAKTDSGNYTCQVTNGHDDLRWTFHVEVHEKIWPLKIVGPQNITARVGADVEFRCNVTNDNTASIRWKKLKLDENGKVIDDRTFIPSYQFDRGVLRLENIRKEDEGYYACQASNNGGSEQSRGNLTVLDPIESDKGMPDEPIPRRGKGKDDTKTDDISSSMGFDEDSLVKTVLQVGQMKPDFGPDFGPDYGPDSGGGRRREKGRRKNKGGRKNKNRKKNRKNKTKKKQKTTPSYVEMPVRPTTPSMPLGRIPFYSGVEIPELPIPKSPHESTTPEIWDFGKKNRDNDDDGMRDTRYIYPSRETAAEEKDTAEDDKSNTLTEGDAANARGNGGNEPKKEGSISAWTIYTIVGAVCGVVLLIGLVAVTLTLCCKREDEGVYKSATPV